MQDNAGDFLRERWRRNWRLARGRSARSFVCGISDGASSVIIRKPSSLDLGRLVSSDRRTARSFFSGE